MIQYIPLKLCIHVGMLTIFLMGLAEKMVDELGQKNFPKTLLLGKVSEFPYRI